MWDGLGGGERDSRESGHRFTGSSGHRKNNSVGDRVIHGTPGQVARDRVIARDRNPPYSTFRKIAKIAGIAKIAKIERHQLPSLIQRQVLCVLFLLTGSPDHVRSPDWENCASRHSDPARYQGVLPRTFW
jgi:hypothetical protein